MYEDLTQNYDPEIHEEYIHPFSCHIIIAMCSLKGNNFLLWLW